MSDQTPKRIQLKRVKGWRMPENTVKVDRSTKWGNPWGIGTPGLLHTKIDNARVTCKTIMKINPEYAVWLFADWLRTGRTISGGMPMPNHFTDAGKMALHDHLHARRKLILANLDQLRGHDLCCFCKPGQPCHADVLLELANK